MLLESKIKVRGRMQELHSIGGSLSCRLASQSEDGWNANSTASKTYLDLQSTRNNGPCPKMMGIWSIILSTSEAQIVLMKELLKSRLSGQTVPLGI